MAKEPGPRTGNPSAPRGRVSTVATFVQPHVAGSTPSLGAALKFAAVPSLA